ncbi:MAG TPA: glycosyltransferase, partial [Stellaceae bacterium]|nr:glycosyltransferase [Stellaceae bacterium]
MTKVRALLVTQYYRPELVGSAPFCGDLAEWLARIGWDPVVLTGLPHYPNAAVFPDYRQAGRRSEWIGGVEVKRLATWVPKLRSAPARMASELWFFVNGCWALASGRIERHGLVYSLCPSILAVALGALARRPHGRHVVLVHDIQSGLARGLGMVRAGWFLRLIQACERRILSRADLIIVLTDEMKEHLRKIGVTARIEVVPIWADTDRIVSVADTPGQSVRLVYSGSFGLKQKVDEILALAALLEKHAPEIHVLLRGSGAAFETLESRAAAEGPRNLRFADLCPPEELFSGMTNADIHLVVQDAAAAAYAVPSKIYNIMAAGLPCIALAERDSALGRLQQTCNGFLTSPPGDLAALLETTLQLARDPALRTELGRNARRHVEAQCAKSAIFRRLGGMVARLHDPSETKAAQDVLIFEPIAEGHPYEWLRYIARQARKAAEDRIVWLVVAPELYPRLVGEVRGIDGDRVRFLPLSPGEAGLCRHRWLWVSSFARWLLARRYLARTRAASAHFLELDLLSLPLAMGLRLGRRPVSGILFRPSNHYRFLGVYEPSWRERLRDLRKQIIYPLMLANPSLAAVLTIDPYFARYAKRTYRNGGKILSVPDPAHQPSESRARDLASAAFVPPQRTLFLMFGYLSERKGALALLDALRLVPDDVGARAAVLLVGKIDPPIREALMAKASLLRKSGASLFFRLDERWLPTSELEALVSGADVVLAPYQRFVGSSGVMLWAARCGKPVLTQEFGVLGRLARDHGLGMTVDCTRPSELAAG